MLPLRIVETEREGFDQTVVELWREDEFVGMVFWDGGATVVQIYPTGDDVHDLEISDLLRVLDTAQRIVDPFAFEQVEDVVQLGAKDDDLAEDPATAALTAEFDPQALHRTEDGEGFFPVAVAAALIDRCQELGLAVVEMEGFDLVSGELKGRPGLTLMIRPEEGTTSFAGFVSYANEQARTHLSNWPQRDSMVIAFVIQQPDGETIVL